MATLSRVGELVRRHDPDRFYTSLFAPAARREALWTLYAFNHELARARETVREPMMALIRLQWWREVVEGARRRHEVAEPLGEALDAATLRRADLLAMIEGREADPPNTDPEWAAYVDSTAGALAAAAGHALAADSPAIRASGAAYGAAGILRNRALQGEPPVAGCFLPERPGCARPAAATSRATPAPPHSPQSSPRATYAEPARSRSAACATSSPSWSPPRRAVSSNPPTAG